MAWGDNTQATGMVATAWGLQSAAADVAATAWGIQTAATASAATAWGAFTVAGSSGATASGIYSRAMGNNSSAHGLNNKATAEASFVVGRFNDTIAGATLFEVGNGTSNTARSNAFTVQSSGNVGVGTVYPTSRLHVAGAVRIADGTQGAGKVLTSDANGLASWQTPPAGTTNYWTASGNSLYNNTGTNIGIGTSNPTGPLSFASISGNKLVLWGDGNASHYGVGVQGGALQLYANQPGDIIAFGTGSSTAFAERARINNTGLEGMYLNGRLHLRNGDPANLGGGGGVWLYKPDNSATMGFMGVQNERNIGFYGGPNLWGFTYDVTNSRVGIGNNLPNAPLAFGATLGKKITLYPGASGDAGFGVAGNRLQIYSDNANADVAIGYDAAGTFNERLAVKPNGALAVNANTGSTGQVLASNGSGSAAAWTMLGDLLKTVVNEGSNTGITVDGVQREIPGSAITITVSRRSRILYSANFTGAGSNCALCAGSSANIVVRLNGTDTPDYFYINAPNGLIAFGSTSISSYALDVEAGTHTITAIGFKQTSGEAMTSLRCLQAMAMAIPIN
jgi:hypothetical protein